MARNCGNERLAMIIQYVALGSMIIMAGAAATQVLRDAFGPTKRDDDRDRPRSVEVTAASPGRSAR